MNLFKKETKKLTAQERGLRQFEIPQSNLKDFAILWDESGKSTSAKLKLWCSIQDLFPGVDFKSGTWHLHYESVFHAFVREGTVEDWED